MSHERFERLILGASPMNPAEEEGLVRHLAGCRACRELHARWMSAEATLTSAAVAGPRPGFYGRWVARQSADAAGRGRRQAWRLFGWTSVGAAGVAAMLGLAVTRAPGLLPNLFAGALQQALRLWIWARLTGEVTRAFALSLPTPVAAAAVVGCALLVAGIGLAATLGAFGIIRFSFQGVRQ
jgi:hypothetical protein